MVSGIERFYCNNHCLDQLQCTMLQWNLAIIAILGDVEWLDLAERFLQFGDIFVHLMNLMIILLRL